MERGLAGGISLLGEILCLLNVRFLNRLQPSEEELICRTECLSNCTKTVWGKHTYDTFALS